MSLKTEFVGVVRMANCYVAVHNQGKNSIFISDKFESDIRVAQVTAKAFAERNNLSYRPGPFDADRPTYTVLKKDTKWYPAAIYPDQVKLHTHFVMGNDKLDVGNEDLEFMKKFTQGIADKEDASFLPNIGIAIDKARNKSKAI